MGGKGSGDRRRFRNVLISFKIIGYYWHFRFSYYVVLVGGCAVIEIKMKKASDQAISDWDRYTIFLLDKRRIGMVYVDWTRNRDIRVIVGRVIDCNIRTGGGHVRKW
jgi:hypothetical protein